MWFPASESEPHRDFLCLFVAKIFIIWLRQCRAMWCVVYASTDDFD